MNREYDDHKDKILKNMKDSDGMWDGIIWKVRKLKHRLEIDLPDARPT